VQGDKKFTATPVDMFLYILQTETHALFLL